MSRYACVCGETFYEPMDRAAHSANCPHYQCLQENTRLRTLLSDAMEVIEWYAEWDWSDKYVQAVPKKARAFLDKLKAAGVE